MIISLQTPLPTQHTTDTRDIHVVGGILTRDPNKRLQTYALDRAANESDYVFLIYTDACQP